MTLFALPKRAVSKRDTSWSKQRASEEEEDTTTDKVSELLGRPQGRRRRRRSGRNSFFQASSSGPVEDATLGSSMSSHNSSSSFSMLLLEQVQNEENEDIQEPQLIKEEHTTTFDADHEKDEDTKLVEPLFVMDLGSCPELPETQDAETESVPVSVTSVNDVDPTKVPRPIKSCLKQSSSIIGSSKTDGHHVTWHVLDIYDHEMQLGDNPSVSSGVPVTIQWTAVHHVRLSIEEYEAHRGPRRDTIQLVLPVTVREDVCRSSGSPRSELTLVRDQVLAIQRHRRACARRGQLRRSLQLHGRHILARFPTNNTPTPTPLSAKRTSEAFWNPAPGKDSTVR